MPLYEYRCTCGCEFDRFTVSGKRRRQRCPRCRAMAAKKISRTGPVIGDTSWPYAGVVDKRLGKDPLRGRKDYERRLHEKGLVEVANNDSSLRD